MFLHLSKGRSSRGSCTSHRCPSHAQPAQCCTPHSAGFLAQSTLFTHNCPAPCLFAISRCPADHWEPKVAGSEVVTAQECRCSHVSLLCRLVEPEGGHWVWAALPREPGAGITAAPPKQNRSRAELSRNWQGVAGFVLGRGGVHDWAWKEPTVRMRRWFRAWTRRAFVHQKSCMFLGGKPTGPPVLQASRASPVPCNL